MGAAFDLVGSKFGRLKVMSRAENTKRGASRWNVLCACGVEKTVRGDVLVYGGAVSCGCYARAVYGKAQKTHGLTNSFEYKAWQSMKTRCNSPKHPAFMRYGGA